MNVWSKIRFVHTILSEALDANEVVIVTCAIYLCNHLASKDSADLPLSVEKLMSLKLDEIGMSDKHLKTNSYPLNAINKTIDVHTRSEVHYE